jgi:hypothetical protein
MNRMIVKSRVGADGVLLVEVPLGSQDANREVLVTIEPAAISRPANEEYSAWLQSVAGKWQGDFERPSQDKLEERDPLP